MTVPFISRTDLGTAIERDLATDDAAVIAIDSACEMVRSYMKQFVNLVEDDDIVMDGSGRTSLVLPEMPVHAISYVAEIVDSVETELTEDTDWVLGQAGILWRIDDTWTAGRMNVHVTYTHGWDVSEDAQTPTDIPRVPSDLRRVALEAANRLYDAGKLPADVAAQIGDYAGEYTSAAVGRPLGVAGLLASERAVLDRYRGPMRWSGAWKPYVAAS